MIFAFSLIRFQPLNIAEAGFTAAFNTD